MDEKAFRTFIDLVEIDQKIDNAARQAESLQQEISSLDTQINQIQNATAAALHKRQDLRKAVDESELELKSLGQLGENKRLKLAMASSPKEFFSLESEIKDIENRVQKHEELGFQQLGQLEVAQKHYDEQKIQEVDQIESLRLAMAEREKQRDFLVNLRHSYIEQRGDFEKNVPADLLERYTSMKEKVPNPVIEILRESCSGCFYSLHKQDLLSAERQQLVTCRSCYRLLYKRRYGNEDVTPE